MRPLHAVAARALCRSLSLSALIVASAAAQAPQPPVPLPGLLPLFPPDNWWNADVSAAPVDPSSAGFIGLIGGSTSLHPDFGATTRAPRTGCTE